MSSRETKIEVDDKLPAVRMIREFDAPPSKVFRAYTDPELFAQWVGPHYLTTRIDIWDCRTGGEYRYVSSHADEEYGFRGTFHEVRPAELIVQTFSFEGYPDGVTLERMVLEELPGGRTRLTGTALCDSFESRDGLVQSGMEVGVNEGYEKLDTLLGTLP